ncbi:MAG: transporter [Frankiales bacterium]|jgi:EmrB/QacA subfamily drug resistance transporter|nr:transporter [Frankiales bacterium]
MTTATAPSTSGLTHKQILTIMSGLLLGMFLASLDQTIVSTAMRTIADKLNGQTAQAWVTTAYLVTSTVSTPLYGKLSDLYGRKPFYLFAIGIFLVGSALCGQAHSIYELAAFRALQGLGAGGLLSLAFAIIGDLVAPRERAKYQAYFTSVFATSSVLGPVLGGFFAGQATILGITGWRWIFYVNVPIGLAAFYVVWRNLALPRHRTEHRIDYLGAALLSSSVVPLLLLAEKGREWGWGSATSLTLIAVGVISLALFIPRESRLGEDAILPLRIFRDRVFSVVSVVATLVGMVMFGGLVLMPLYLQIVRGESPTSAGLMMTPFMVGLMGASLVTGRVMQRTGRYKIFPIFGTAVLFVGMLLFSTLKVDTPIPQAMAYMVVVGIGLGLTMQMLVISVQNALPPEDMGLSTSAVTFFRSMGGTLGAAVALAVLFGTVVGNIKDRLADSPYKAFANQVTGAKLDNTSNLFANMPAPLKRLVLEGFADSMHTVFVVVAFLVIPAFVLTFFIKEVPLRTTGGIAAQEEKPDGDLAMAETAVL